MADQATLNSMNNPVRNGSPPRGDLASSSGSSRKSTESTASTMVENVAGFGENLLLLGELHARLAALELRRNILSARAAAGLGIAGGLLGVGSAPLFLAGIAELLVSELAMKRGHALLIVAVAGIGVAALVVTIAGFWLGRKRLGFPLSSEEFTRNLNWVRSVLRHSGRSRR